MRITYPTATFCLGLILGLLAPASAAAEWEFVEVGADAKVGYTFDYAIVPDNAYENMAGGVASGDFDQDGHIDLYLVTGDVWPNRLLRNTGNGEFEDVTEAAGVGIDGHFSSSPAFADIDGDGLLDLFVGGIRGWGHYIFRNNGDGTFSDVTDSSGIYWEENEQNEYSAAFGDPDGDGDLDAFISHWGARGEINHFWINDGTGKFSPADLHSGYVVRNERDYTFTPTFADVNADGRQDMLLVADFDRTQLLINQGNNQWLDATTDVFTDESGMGSAVADFDNDGDLDWFVTSIFQPDPNNPAFAEFGATGNRLYLNDGAGNFSDGTEEAGVRNGHWGWGACAADFNNDGWLDIFHVNGWPQFPQELDYTTDPSRLFINNGDGTFSEQAGQLGLIETDQGRGVACFDYDQDGDIDILSQNWKSPANLWRNDLDPGNHWIQVRLQGEANNPHAIGAIIRLTAGGVTQMREITVGSNFASQNPLVQHFGLGSNDSIDSIEVTWPHGGTTSMTQVTPDRLLTLSAPQAEPEAYKLAESVSGAWFDPGHNGEGFLLERINDNLVILYWFTYDSEGQQDWYFAAGSLEGRRVLFPELIRVSGGGFGPDYDPANITKTVVGSAAFTWTDCNTAFMDWYQPGAQAEVEGTRDRQELLRLTSLMGLECGKEPQIPDPLHGKQSGSWFDPTHDGEGFIVQTLPTGEVLVYWFGYSPHGDRRWFFGLGEARDGKLVVDEMSTTLGGVFGKDFDPESVEVKPWGSLELDIDCNAGTATYNSTEEGFGNGQLNVVRLSTLDGLGC